MMSTSGAHRDTRSFTDPSMLRDSLLCGRRPWKHYMEAGGRGAMLSHNRRHEHVCAAVNSLGVCLQQHQRCASPRQRRAHGHAEGVGGQLKWDATRFRHVRHRTAGWPDGRAQKNGVWSCRQPLGCRRNEHGCGNGPGNHAPAYAPLPTMALTYTNSIMTCV